MIEDTVSIATACVDASVNTLHNVQRLLMAIYMYTSEKKREGETVGLSLSRVQERGKNARGGHK